MLSSNTVIIFLVLYNNIFYTEVALVFHLQKAFIFVCNNTDTFCYFLLQKDFYIVRKHIDTFCFYFLQKDFNSFHDPFFEDFLCFFFFVFCL